MTVFRHEICQECGQPLSVREIEHDQEICERCILGWDPIDEYDSTRFSW